MRQAPGPLEYVRFGNPNAREIEIIPFKDKNIENASASGGKPPDPLNMLNFEIVSCDIPFYVQMWFFSSETDLFFQEKQGFLVFWVVEEIIF